MFVEESMVLCFVLISTLFNIQWVSSSKHPIDLSLRRTDGRENSSGLLLVLETQYFWPFYALVMKESKFIIITWPSMQLFSQLVLD